ncbi:MAG: ATP-binding protein [Luteolibacter sp.]
MSTPKSMLAGVKKGPVIRPHFVLLHGVDGVGKSTFGAAAPSPIFLGPEDGLGLLDVARFPTPKNWLEIRAAVSDLQSEEHEYETLVIDSIDWIEPMLWNYICLEHKVATIAQVGDGFGQGYVVAQTQWQELIKQLQRLRMKMNVIVIAHSHIKAFDDPSKNEKYDRYLLKLNDKAAAIWREAVDCVFFANFQTTTTKQKGSAKARAFGDGTRVMFTERRPAFDAKNRFNLPFEMPLDWKVFADAVTAAAKVTPDQSASPDAIAALLKGNEAEALAFLVANEWLEEGQTLADLPPSRRTSILARPEAFLQAIASHQPEPTPTENE